MKTRKVYGVYSCDNCGLMINDVFDRSWIKGSFQRGKNKAGKTATWCSEACYIVNKIKENPLDATQWQALGKALGKDYPAWWYEKAMSYFERILTGGNTEKFWKELLNQ